MVNGKALDRKAVSTKIAKSILATIDEFDITRLKFFRALRTAANSYMRRKNGARLRLLGSLEKSCDARRTFQIGAGVGFPFTSCSLHRPPLTL